MALQVSQRSTYSNMKSSLQRWLRELLKQLNTVFDNAMRAYLLPVVDEGVNQSRDSEHAANNGTDACQEVGE